MCNCTNDAIKDSQKAESSLSDIELLKQLGYNLTGMTECDDYYLIKPDIIVSKNRLDEIRKEPQTRMQYRKTNGVLDIQYQTIYLNPAIETRYQPEFDAAVEAWNNLENTNIKFVVAKNDASAVNISMWFNGTSDSNFISVERPHNGFYGKYISINLSSFPASPNAIPYKQVQYLIMHALGHLVGLEHVYGQNDGSPSTTWDLYPGTDKFDAKSIMRAEDFLNQNRTEIWSGFSASDKKAISIIYPTIDDSESVKEILCNDQAGQTITSSILNIGVPYSFTPKYVSKYCTNPSYSISIQEINGATDGWYDYGLRPGFKQMYDFKFIKPGQYRITVKVDNAPSPIAYNKIYTIYAQEPWIEGPKIIELGKVYDFSISCWNPNYPNTTFSMAITENLFNDPQYTIISQTNNSIKIRFDEPGEYSLEASMQNGPSINTGSYRVNVYYYPYYKYNPTEKRIYFYTDANYSIPLKLPHRTYFSYRVKLEILRPIPKVKILMAKVFANPGDTFIDLKYTPEDTPSIPKSSGTQLNRYEDPVTAPM